MFFLLNFQKTQNAPFLSNSSTIVIPISACALPPCSLHDPHQPVLSCPSLCSPFTSDLLQLTFRPWNRELCSHMPTQWLAMALLSLSRYAMCEPKILPQQPLCLPEKLLVIGPRRWSYGLVMPVFLQNSVVPVFLQACREKRQAVCWGC